MRYLQCLLFSALAPCSAATVSKRTMLRTNPIKVWQFQRYLVLNLFTFTSHLTQSCVVSISVGFSLQQLNFFSEMLLFRKSSARGGPGPHEVGINMAPRYCGFYSPTFRNKFSALIHSMEIHWIINSKPLI